MRDEITAASWRGTRRMKVWPVAAEAAIIVAIVYTATRMILSIRGG